MAHIYANPFITIISLPHFPTKAHLFVLLILFLPMAHRSTHHHRHKLAPRPSSSVDSTPATSFTSTSSHHCPSPKPDLILPSKPSSLLHHFSSVNLNHNHSLHPQPLPPYSDSHLQAKSLTSSVILHSSKTHHSQPPLKLEKEYKPAKKMSKEKPQKYVQELERRKLQVQGVLKNEKVNDSCAGHNGRSLTFGDDVKRPSVSLAPISGRRRSFCGSQVDLGDVFAVNGAKVVSVDMPPFMQIHAVDCARKTFDSMEKFTSKTLALALKKEFDGAYGPAWHCIVGTSFGSFVTHSVGGFLYFSMDQKLYVLLFKTTVQKAD